MANYPTTGSWFRVYTPRPEAPFRLVCFPHAGGSASSYRAWAQALPPAIELVAVQYPGRQDRFGEPVPSDIPALAERISVGLGGRLDRTTAFFGHSMGAVVAFEVARRLQPRFPPPIIALFASACNAPVACRPVGLTFADEEIRQHVRDFGGEGGDLIHNNELFQLALPALRADLRMTEDYRYDPGPPLTCPVVAVTGDDDPAVTLADVRRWREHTVASFETHLFPGGHFYLERMLPRLAALLVDRLAIFCGGDERLVRA